MIRLNKRQTKKVERKSFWVFTSYRKNKRLTRFVMRDNTEDMRREIGRRIHGYFWNEYQKIK